MRVKFKQLRHFAGAATVALGLAGCAAIERPASVAPAAPQPLAHLTVATPDPAHDLMAHLMAAEMALAHNDLRGAAAGYGAAMALSDDPGVARQAAELALAVHDAPAAERAIARWQALGAGAPALAQARAQLALSRGDTAEAKRQLAALIDSGDPQAWRQFGRTLVGARDPAQAAQLLEALATPGRLPADKQAWLAMSQLGDKLGRPAYATRIAEAAIARFHDPETYTWAAHLKLQAGDQAGARALLRQALARAPGDLRVRMAYASLLGQAGDYATAAKLLEHGTQDARTYALRAALAARAHDHKAIARVYAEARRAAPAVRGDSSFLLGQLAEMLGRPREALDWYDQVGDQDSHAFDADLRSAVILHGQGKRDQAHALLEQLQTAYLDQPEELRRAYEADAELSMRERDYPRAASAYSHALQVVPDDPDLLYGRGLAWAEAGQIDKAVADLRQVLKVKPGDVDAANALGYTLADAGRDLPEARRLIEKARTAKPHDPAIADSWGWLQYRLGHLAEAAQTLRGAWQARKDADVGVHLGEVLWKQGHTREARRIFEQVRRIDPHSSSLHAALERLKP